MYGVFSYSQHGNSHMQTMPMFQGTGKQFFEAEMLILLMSFHCFLKLSLLTVSTNNCLPF